MTLLLSLVGMLALMFIAWLASENRRAIRWRTVLGALALQTGFAALVLYFPPGQIMLGAMSNGVSALLGFADSGINLQLGFWIRDPAEGTLGIRSAINMQIWRRFKEEGIEIPFPQREVRVLGEGKC